jgi:ribonuclease BN (tRNA processing enzyme)
LSGTEAYRLVPHTLGVDDRAMHAVFRIRDVKLSAVPVHHGPVPALAWRLDLAGRSVVFSGDMNGDFHTLEKLAQDADLLVAHNAIPEGATGVARNLHMPPSVIGEIAAAARVKRLVLSHRMLRTLGREDETRREIETRYGGPVSFADDLSCFPF